MGEDDLNAAVAHAVLCCVCAPLAGKSGFVSRYTAPGMHTNLFLYGVIGCLNFQSSKVGTDLTAIYKISLAASRYLPLACVNADIHRGNEMLCALHVLSGIVPLAIALSGKDNPHLGNAMIAVNIVALAYHAFDRSRTWAWYTVGAALLAYFGAPTMGATGPKVMYPLCLCLVEYCGSRMSTVVLF